MAASYIDNDYNPCIIYIMYASMTRLHPNLEDEDVLPTIKDLVW